MAQAMVNFRMDKELKMEMEQACKDMGMSVTTAFTIFATKVSKERRIPFDVTADPDPFYSDTNMNRLRKAISDVKSGKAKLTEHELI
jgi:DNA-damage-inducible protein J